MADRAAVVATGSQVNKKAEIAPVVITEQQIDESVQLREDLLKVKTIVIQGAKFNIESAKTQHRGTLKIKSPNDFAKIRRQDLDTLLEIFESKANAAKLSELNKVISEETKKALEEYKKAKVAAMQVDGSVTLGDLPAMAQVTSPVPDGRKLSSLETLQGEIASLKAEMAARDKDIQEKTAQRDQLTKDLETLAKVVAEVQEKLAAAEKELPGLQAAEEEMRKKKEEEDRIATERAKAIAEEAERKKNVSIPSGLPDVDPAMFQLFLQFRQFMQFQQKAESNGVVAPTPVDKPTPHVP